MLEARSTTPVCSYFLKLVVMISTRYEPGRRLVASKRPSASVSAVRGTPVLSSVIRTDALATAAPCGSTTVPRIVPRKDCADTLAATPSRARSANTTNRGRAGRGPPPVVNRNVCMFFLLGVPPITGRLPTPSPGVSAGAGVGSPAIESKRQPMVTFYNFLLPLSTSFFHLRRLRGADLLRLRCGA